MTTATKQGHTPGPWTVHSAGNGRPYERDWREIWPSVVTASNYSTNRHGEQETVCGVRISEGNARLISMAPELLEALKEALPLLQDHQNLCRSVRAAEAFLKSKAIISKAEAAPWVGMGPTP